MSDQLTSQAAEARAQRRYIALNAARWGSLLAVIAGIAGARGVIALPYPLTVALAIGGVIGFFFAPPLLARRFKAHDAAASDEERR
ncbi:MAG: hypothetical protein AAF707_05960 [Pseudomonadota bacterium]